MKTITIKVYEINEHPNKEAVFAWIRENWYDLNNHSVEEFADSLKELQKAIGGILDYSVCACHDRGEFITLKGYDKELLNDLAIDDYPLTGVCWDANIIEALKDGNIEHALHSLHADTEYLYSNEALEEMCEGNGYYFLENGEFHS